MNVVICGAGEVGRYAAQSFAAAGGNITVIDQQAGKLEALEESMDVRILQGSATHAEVLLEAGCASADLFLAATSIDEINLLSAAVAKALGAARCVARVHHSNYFENRGLDYARHLRIDHLVCPEQSTADAIAQVIRSPGALAMDRFAGGKIEMQQLVVAAGASALDQELSTVNLPRGTRIAAIDHGGNTFLPTSRSRIHAGDVVTLIGNSENFARACRLMDPRAGRRRRVVVVGGSSMGVWLCRALRTSAFSVLLIVSERARAEELASKLEWVTVVLGDPADESLFDEHRVAQADAFVALSDDDEQNILAAARAKSLGVASAMTVLQRATYLHLIRHVGIDRAFSPRTAAVAQIQKLLDAGPVRHLTTLAAGVAEVYEVHVSTAAGQCLGKPLREVKLPQGVLIAAIQRGGDAFVPVADDMIQPQDVMIVVGPAGIQSMLRQVFGPA